MWMRGGTSKGAFFLEGDLPESRDRFLLRMMGSPDRRQIDGMGGADSLTSKVAVVRKSQNPGCDIDYRFLQVSVDDALVSDRQNCGNMLAAVAPFAIERGLIQATDPETSVTVHLLNTGGRAIATIQTPEGHPLYKGNTRIAGVPGTAAPVLLDFLDIAGSTCGSLLPTDNASDIVNGIYVTMIDNGMPVVVIKASDMGITGHETPEDLEANHELKSRIETIRLACGHLMGLGDVSRQTVPKISLVSPPRQGGMIATRTFIPHKCHAAIGVLGAVSVATSCLVKGSISNGIVHRKGDRTEKVSVEHPSGEVTIMVRLEGSEVTSAALLRTARKLFDGRVFA